MKWIENRSDEIIELVKLSWWHGSFSSVMLKLPSFFTRLAHSCSFIRGGHAWSSCPGPHFLFPHVLLLQACKVGFCNRSCRSGPALSSSAFSLCCLSILRHANCWTCRKQNWKYRTFSRLAGDQWLLLICFERKILLVSCWWLIYYERKYCWLVANKSSKLINQAKCGRRSNLPHDYLWKHAGSWATAGPDRRPISCWARALAMMRMMNCRLRGQRTKDKVTAEICGNSADCIAWLTIRSLWSWICKNKKRGTRGFVQCYLENVLSTSLNYRGSSTFFYINL